MSFRLKRNEMERNGEILYRLSSNVLNEISRLHFVSLEMTRVERFSKKGGS